MRCFDVFELEYFLHPEFQSFVVVVVWFCECFYVSLPLCACICVYVCARVRCVYVFMHVWGGVHVWSVCGCACVGCEHVWSVHVWSVCVCVRVCSFVLMCMHMEAKE